MKIKPESNLYRELTEQLKKGYSVSKEEIRKGIKKAKEYAAPKIKETTQTAADWVEEKIQEAKEYAAPKIKETAQKAADLTEEAIESAKCTYARVRPKVDEFIAYAQFALNPPKIETLSKKMTEAQKEYLAKTVYYDEYSRQFPEEYFKLHKMKIELHKLQQKAQKATDEYNSFAARQAAAQRAFEQINNF